MIKTSIIEHWTNWKLHKTFLQITLLRLQHNLEVYFYATCPNFTAMVRSPIISLTEEFQGMKKTTFGIETGLSLPPQATSATPRLSGLFYRYVNWLFVYNRWTRTFLIIQQKTVENKFIGHSNQNPGKKTLTKKVKKNAYKFWMCIFSIKGWNLKNYDIGK